MRDFFADWVVSDMAAVPVFAGFAGVVAGFDGFAGAVVDFDGFARVVVLDLIDRVDFETFGGVDSVSDMADFWLLRVLRGGIDEMMNRGCYTME